MCWEVGHSESMQTCFFFPLKRRQQVITVWEGNGGCQEEALQ